MMTGASYIARRGQIRTYFDRTALDAWKRFAGEEKLSRIRETVRAGRAEMRAALLSTLPEDLSGWRVLDAGCGAGMMTRELAARGADVLGVDLSPEIIRFAEETSGADPRRARFLAGDMLGDYGDFDAVVAMDSLIHYAEADAAAAISVLAGRARARMAFTVAPRTPLLGAMHAAGRLFPRSDRAPAIEPVAPRRLAARLGETLPGWRAAPAQRVSRGFYISQAMEAARA